MQGRISIRVTDGVADVKLTRSEKMNALDHGMFEALVEAGEKLKADRSVRVVVLSGEGRAFCAGLDMGNFSNMAEGSGGKAVPRDLIARTHGAANRPQYAVWVWRELPVPVIAAVHGVAFGGGFQLALGADIRYVAPDTRMSVMEIKWGLVPDMAGTQLMRHLAREDIVRELTYTGRVFTGQEAFAMGFATRVTDEPYGDAMTTAREIASKSPDAIRASKRILNSAVITQPVDGLTSEAAEQQVLIGSPNQVEAIMSNLEKRAPRYADPAA
ncbi:crotonase/enoyl-CoA hydratase family protein [Chelatococcus reniformis]|uniref:Enoyl-CoA hydratase n=1 Tax=Chelatococcus reniformis TaxID=1494448 RepID=A0A916UCJ1_9HYPH|nr:crotonase/enoyl-CoA hydratase family protein [Chelatococcus reniformis]GGC66030.1 enoyl-CoA hydratase [Chelatococcus reniformis]